MIRLIRKSGVKQMACRDEAEGSNKGLTAGGGFFKSEAFLNLRLF